MSVDAFLREHGWGEATLAPLAEAGASLRRYQRVTSPTGRSAILTIASDPALEITKFCKVANILRSHGLSAPEIYAADEAAGLLLQEDFGDASYARLIQDGAPAMPLAVQAMDVLCAVQSIPAAELAGIPVYDFDLWYSVTSKSFAENLLNFYMHYLPCVGAAPLTTEEQNTYKNLWQKAYATIDGGPTVLLLRDYKFANQMHLPSRSGIARTGLIDFQDAGVGTPYYDLVETCEPWASEPDKDVREAALTRYLHGRTDITRDQLELGLKTITALRWIAWLSNCARYARQGRLQYLALVPRIWRAAERNLAAPELTELRRWFDHYAPMHLRAPTQVAA